MDIELCIYYNIVTIWFLFIIQSINLPPSAHTTAAITSSLHTATMYSHVQLSAANIQCTLQLYYLMLIPYSASSEEG